MLFDIPESLIEKCRKVMESSRTEEKKQPSEEEKEEPKRKGEKVTFNPEIKPDVYTEPYKVQPTT